jgi:isoleucyl-tRNA synthetase
VLTDDERRAAQAALHFATQELSSFHCDVTKDRLYNDSLHSAEGRAARTTLWLCLRALLHTVAPMVPHTVEDVFLHLPPACRAALPAYVPPLPTRVKGTSCTRGTEPS